MTDPTEQTAGPTVLEAIASQMPNLFNTTNHQLGEKLREELAENAVAALGLDPSAPVARLVADLAIAARARACTPLRANYLFGPQYVEVAGETFASARALLAYLLGDEA